MKRLTAVLIAGVVVGVGGYWAFLRPRPQSRPIESVTVSGSDLVVAVMTGAEPCESGLRVGVDESGDTVRLTATVRRDGDATCPSIAVRQTRRVTLGAPLGQRRVVDGHDDRGIDVLGR